MSDEAVITLREVYDAVQELRLTIGTTPVTVADHERRIRVLEQRVWQAAGAAAVLVALASMIAQRVIGS